MKRVGNLTQRIADMENLREAFLRAARGKSGKREVVLFREDFDNNLVKLHQALSNGCYAFGKYHYFQVYDPKQRTICAAAFDERVVQHAMMRILHPVFDRFQIYNSYACRLEKGTYKAVERARHFARQYRWFAKMDVQKFFDTVDHEILMGQLSHLIKDKTLFPMLRQLVESYEVDKGRGLPIGNLSSQYFANHYLAVADHFALEQLHVAALVRYMDDFVVWGNDLSLLKQQAELLRDFIFQRLNLKLHPVIINRSTVGLPFLGYVVYPHTLRLTQRSRRHFRRKWRGLEQQLAEGRLTEAECLQRYTAMYAFVEKAETKAYLRKIAQHRTSP